MNGWIKTIIGLTITAALLLSLAWRHLVYAPQQAQVEFTALMADAAPLLKLQKPKLSADIAASMRTLLDTPQPDENDEKRAERLAAKKTVDSALDNKAAKNEAPRLASYKAKLNSLEPRFAALDYRRLTPCQRNDAYRNWGALSYWKDWAKDRSSYETASDDAIRQYELKAARYAGRPVSLDEIKAVGEAQYTQVLAELKTLEEQVRSEFGQSLNDFALREENFSTASDDIVTRMTPLLTDIETKFIALGDFGFSPVPPAIVKTLEKHGPRYAIASYERRDNAMIIYWAEGRYNHVYDTMLIVHEIMPGHHQQITMEKQRACGRGPIAARTSFLEGWATYAEFLADERGLFSAPDQRLGWLDYRLVRAMRIIMDTARLENDLTEAKAWVLWQEKMPRRLDDDFPREWARINTSPHYISYIFGAQAILDARENLQGKLGSKFDEVEFHAALLNAPHQSLLFLPERIEAQMQARAALP